MKEQLHGESKLNVSKCKYIHIILHLLTLLFYPYSKDVRLPVSMQRSMAAEAEGETLISIILTKWLYII